MMSSTGILTPLTDTEPERASESRCAPGVRSVNGGRHDPPATAAEKLYSLTYGGSGAGYMPSARSIAGAGKMRVYAPLKKILGERAECYVRFMRLHRNVMR